MGYTAEVGFQWSGLASYTATLTRRSVRSVGMLCFVSGRLGDREMESMIMSLDASAHSAQDPYMTVEHLGVRVRVLFRSGQISD